MANFEGLRKPAHKSSNYAFWRCGFSGYDAAEKLTEKLQNRGFKQIKTMYNDGRVSVHVYF